MKKSRVGYIDKTDFDYELGEARSGNIIYPSLSNILENETCSQECGVYKVKISIIESAHEGVSELHGKTIQELEAYQKSEEYLNHIQERLRKAEATAAFWRNRVETLKAKL